jgi:hypothetical protein
LVDNGESGFAAGGFPLFKISFGLSHLVGHVGKADDLVVPGLGQRVEGCGLHLHRQDALGAAMCDQRLRLPKGRIGRPARAHMQGNPLAIPVCADYLSQRRIQGAVGCGWQIVSSLFLRRAGLCR